MRCKKDTDFIFDENENYSLAISIVLGDRDEQQDCFGYDLSHEDLFVVVCDGMGGHAEGRQASSVAVDTVFSVYNNASEEDISEFLINSTKAANDNVFRISTNSSGAKAGSTLVSLLIHDKYLFWNSVGDSRAYLCRNGAYIQFTRDHNYKSVLESKKNAGIISDSEYEEEIIKGEALICHLGLRTLELIDYNDSPFSLTEDDTIVIMSDGLYKVLSDAEIFSIVNNFSNASDALNALEYKAAKAAKVKNMSRDNTTIAIIKIKG